MDTNLYDFLRTVHAAFAHPSSGTFDGRYGLKITKSEFEWLTTFLRNPGTVIEFRARPTGRMAVVIDPDAEMPRFAEYQHPVVLPQRQEPEMEKHFALAGTAEEVFGLLNEAMVLNPTFAQLVLSAGRAYAAKAPLCRKCGQRHHGRLVEDCPDIVTPKWEFKNRPL